MCTTFLALACLRSLSACSIAYDSHLGLHSHDVLPIGATEINVYGHRSPENTIFCFKKKSDILLCSLGSCAWVYIFLKNPYLSKSRFMRCFRKGYGNDGEPDARWKLAFEKKAKNWLKLKNYGWFGMIFENIKSDLPKEVRGQSWPWRSHQKHVKMTSNYILVDGLKWYLRIFNLTYLKRSEAKVDLQGYFKNMSKWLQITYLWLVWDDIWEYSIWPA